MSVSACSSLLPNRPSSRVSDSSSSIDESSYENSSSSSFNSSAYSWSGSSSSSSSQSQSQTYTDADFKYQTNFDGTLTVSSGKLQNMDNLGDVVIPERYQGKKITAIAENGFSNLNSMTSITIPLYVKDIGLSAFAYCNRLATIYWNAQSVSDYASSFDSVVNGSNSFKNVVFGNEVERIPGQIFAGCNSLTNVTFGENIIEIAFNAFASCTSVKRFDMPTSLRTIGDGAFQVCFSLTTANIGPNVREIGNNAFIGCQNLQSVSVPNSIEKLGYSIFDECPALSFENYNGAFYLGNSSNRYVLLYKVYSTSMSELNVHQNCLYIGQLAAGNCQNLRQVNLNEGLKYIDRYAFESCTNLEKINFPASLIEAREGFSNNCHSIFEYNVDSNNTHYVVENGSLYSYDKTVFVRHPARGRNTVTMNSATKKILDGAFSGCNIQSITLSDAIEEVEGNPFSGASFTYNEYKNGYYLGSANNPYLVFISPFGNVSNFEISNTCKAIVRMAFFLNNSIVSLTVPSSVTSISESAFDSMNNLETLTVQNGVSKIGRCAFAACPKLTSVVLPDSVTSMGDYLFRDCQSLISVRLPSNITKIEAGMFEACMSLTTFTVPDTVTEIGANAFFNCSSLIDIVLSQRLERIREYAFQECNIIQKFFYHGSEDNWSLVKVYREGNYSLSENKIYYYSENQTAGGHYWHYVDGLPTVW